MSRLSLLCLSLLKFINSFMHYPAFEVSILVLQKILFSTLCQDVSILLMLCNDFLCLNPQATMVKKYYIRWCATGPSKIVENTFGAIEYNTQTQNYFCILGLVLLLFLFLCYGRALVPFFYFLSLSLSLSLCSSPTSKH